MRGPRTQQERVERARETARARLAAIEAGTTTVSDCDDMVQVALQDYRLRFPGSKATNAWLYYDGDPTTKVIRGKPERVDVYCTFCRVMLVSNAVYEFELVDRERRSSAADTYDLRLRPHTTLCALKCLARVLEPGAPGSYRLPPDLGAAT